MKPHPVRVEAARPLTTAQEIALLEAVVAARPGAGAIAVKLASLLIVADRFDEALALLEGPQAAPVSFYAAMLRFQAHISIEDAAHDEAACVAAEDAAALADFLLSDAAGWITGQVMAVDGGRSTVRTRG